MLDCSYGASPRRDHKRVKSERRSVVEPHLALLIIDYVPVRYQVN
jgi:hypothetical protein